jgi:hypothetical protein
MFCARRTKDIDPSPKHVEPFTAREPRRGQHRLDQMEGGRKPSEQKICKPLPGAIEREKGMLLDSQQVSRSDGFGKGKCAGVRDKKM